MRKAIFSILLFTAAAASYANGFFSLGGAGALFLEDPPPFMPDVRLFAGADLLAPLSPEWSMFFSGSFLHYLRPVDQQFRYLYSGAYDFSFRDGDFFFQTGLKAKGERLFASAYSWPDRFENAFEIRLSYDIGDATLFIAPELCYNQEDFLEDNLLLRGAAGLTWLLSDRMVATAQAKGRLTLVPLHYTAASGGGEIVLSHYPDAPFFYLLTLGALAQTSSYEETLLSTPLRRLDYFQAYLHAEFAFSLAEALLLKVTLPVKGTFRAMPAVRDGGFNGESEWTLALGPEVELDIGLAEKQKLVLLLKCEPFFSNSDYYDAGYGELAVTYHFSW